MSKIFIIQNVDCQSISATITKLSKVYGTPKVMFSDMMINLESFAIEGIVRGEQNIRKALAVEDVLAAGVPVGSASDKILSHQGQVVATTEPIIPDDVLFVEFEKDNATSLVLLVKYQSIVNPPQNLPTYSEFTKAAQKLAEYYGEKYSDDDTLRELIQGVVTARFNHEQCS